MARNSEKAQSMLYRFRETQAIESGMGDRQKGERRPRMASSVTNLRDCERWRGDIMRDISRKVSKIQDSTLSDYQVRDLNDEINGLLREKRHYETQIVNLGGANYKRGNMAMLDDDGKEVPGTRGYKYFGRARDLPGVKEMFSKSKTQATEESSRNASFQMFRNQGPDYYGDGDEGDAELLEEEERYARQEWEAAVAQTAEILNLPDTTSIPFPSSTSSTASSSTTPAVAAASTEQPSVSAPETKSTPKGKGRKGKGQKRSGDMDVDDDDELSKKAKTDNEDNDNENGAVEVEGQASVSGPTSAQPPPNTPGLSHAFLSMLDPESLKHPVMPSTEEMSKVLLEVRKNAIRAEYGV